MANLQEKITDKDRNLWTMIYKTGKKKPVSSASSAGKTGQLHVSQLKLEYTLTPCTETNSEWLKDLNMELSLWLRSNKHD